MADTAIGARPDDRLAKELESVKVPVITAGDGAAIGYIEGALASGFASAKPREAQPNDVLVNTYATNGNLTDKPFHLQVFC